MLKRITNSIIRKIVKIFGFFNKLNESQILFMSYGGSAYSDSQRFISERIHELNKSIKIIWLINNPKKTNSNIPTYVIVKKNTIHNFAKYVSSSICVLNNFEYTNRFYKRKRQIFIQTYHGDRGFKKVSYGAHPFDGIAIDYKITDLCIAGSDYGEQVYKECLLYKGEILKKGMPRNDALVNIDKQTDRIQKIRKVLKLNNKSNILLYAPTFRDTQSNFMCEINFVKIIELLKEKYNSEWTLILRKHHGMQNLSCNNLPDNFIDASDYDDMSDLLLVSDFLITDFSSCAGDFVLTNKPIVLCPFDFDYYTKNCRNLNMESIKSPGYYVAFNQEELESLIREKTIEDFKNRNKKVMEFYKVNETGKSSEIICEWIFDRIKGKI